MKAESQEYEEQGGERKVKADASVAVIIMTPSLFPYWAEHSVELGKHEKVRGKKPTINLFFCP